MKLTQITGIPLILLPIAFNVIFFLLQRTFEYPDILRRPTDYILSQFNAGGHRLIFTWYSFALTGLLFIPMAVLVDQVLAQDNLPYMALATVSCFSSLSSVCRHGDRRAPGVPLHQCVDCSDCTRHHPIIPIQHMAWIGRLRSGDRYFSRLIRGSWLQATRRDQRHQLYSMVYLAHRCRNRLFLH